MYIFISIICLILLLFFIAMNLRLLKNKTRKNFSFKEKIDHSNTVILGLLNIMVLFYVAVRTEDFTKSTQSQNEKFQSDLQASSDSSGVSLVHMQLKFEMFKQYKSDLKRIDELLSSAYQNDNAIYAYQIWENNSLEYLQFFPSSISGGNFYQINQLLTSCSIDNSVGPRLREFRILKESFIAELATEVLSGRISELEEIKEEVVINE